MMDIHYKIMTAADGPETFYAKIGHFLASRQVRKEIGGYPLSNEDDWPWMVALEKRHFDVIGFVCMKPNKNRNRLTMHDYYIIEEYRGHGVFRTLIEKIIHYADNEQKDLYASVNQKLQQVFEKRGFAVVGRRGQWLTMRRLRDEKGLSK